MDSNLTERQEKNPERNIPMCPTPALLLNFCFASPRIYKTQKYGGLPGVSRVVGPAGLELIWCVIMLSGVVLVATGLTPSPFTGWRCLLGRSRGHGPAWGNSLALLPQPSHATRRF